MKIPILDAASESAGPALLNLDDVTEYEAKPG
jgi:hypothetical protein